MAQAQLTHQAEPPAPKGVTMLAFDEAGDQQRVEVFKGEIVATAPRFPRLSQVSRTVFLSLYDFAAKNNLGEVWQESAYIIEGDKARDWVYRARVPDVSYISRERVVAHNAEHGPDEGPWWLVPDLAVEIVSPIALYNYIDAKVEEYLRFGVQLVWLMNPAQGTVRVFTPDNPGGALLDSDAILSCDPVLPGWSMLVKDIFAS